MIYRKCGNSGVQLPALSLGMWHNFGSVDDFGEAARMVLKAFDAGICHFDLANNYGPVPGSAESNFGRILREQLASHRDEMFISSKAGHDMWPGVYGTGSSRKNLFASCDQSLKRMGLEYVDVFYSHRYDGVTPIEETMQALVDIVRSGRALYVGISKYPVELQRRCYEYLAERDVPCLLSQYPASMYRRRSGINRLQDADTNIATASASGTGVICFSPLAQGLLTDKYLDGIPAGSRAARPEGFLKEAQVSAARVGASRQLNVIAAGRGQTLAQFALSWLLQDNRVTSAIIGPRNVAQLEDNLRCLERLDVTPEEMAAVDAVLSGPELEM